MSHFRQPERKTQCHCEICRQANRGNPVLPLGKTNAARRFNDIALRFSGYLNCIRNSVLQRLTALVQTCQFELDYHDLGYAQIS
ncbi:MAG: hypothetical protein IKH45_03720 [Neisseriaceae bacterium]|nr:hypothetical protein [Neisseriaceae bacterium]MBR3481981.1 hypothetical protein [Neisseriaceae bacterium]